MQVSVDGFVAGPNGEMDWMVWDWDEELMNYVKALTEPVDCIVLGRVLAQGFINHWANAATQPNADFFTHKMVDTPKVVFTKTLETSEWPNTYLAKESLVDEVAQLKNQLGQDIILYGGSGLTSSFIQHNLIDEYHFFVNPTVLGSGMPIFKNVTDKLSLQLVKATGFSCGIVVLRYEPKRS